MFMSHVMYHVAPIINTRKQLSTPHVPLNDNDNNDTVPDHSVRTVKKELLIWVFELLEIGESSKYLVFELFELPIGNCQTSPENKTISIILSFVMKHTFDRIYHLLCGQS